MLAALTAAMGSDSKQQRLALRGGYFASGVGAGLFALNLNNSRTGRNRTVGFRPAFAPSLEAAWPRLCGQQGQKGITSPPTLVGKQQWLPRG